MKPIRKHEEALTAPDVDGRVVEDLAVAVPAAVGGGAAAGRVVPADVAEDLVLAAVAQVQQLQVRVALAVARREAEAPHSVHLHEGQVELLGRREVGGAGESGVSDPVSPSTDDTGRCANVGIDCY